MSESPVECVCFDWGGVILRICRAWGEGCERAGLPVRGGLGDRPFANERKGIAGEFQLGRLAPGKFFDRVSAAMGGLYTAAEVQRVHHAWLIEEYPGVDALMNDLHTAGVTTALLSNTNQTHWERQRSDVHPEWPSFPTAGRVRLPHASHLLGLAKPHEEIYRAFEQATGYAGGQIIFFDDLAENIDTATRLGWRGVLIDHTGDTAQQMREALRAHRVI